MRGSKTVKVHVLADNTKPGVSATLGDAHLTTRCPYCMHLVTGEQLKMHKRYGCAASVKPTMPAAVVTDGDDS